MDASDCTICCAPAGMDMTGKDRAASASGAATVRGMKRVMERCSLQTSTDQPAMVLFPEYDEAGRTGGERITGRTPASG
ncbi:hypothetical protein GCM10022268_08670 [Sphingomonas cynarae]|uniref:Uncharacterized protein n=1 Tax=Sphingomonas cynarae TaxID=930197 RepID=A0ABP7D8Y0_9SPHN